MELPKIKILDEKHKILHEVSKEATFPKKKAEPAKKDGEHHAGIQG